MTSIDRPGCGRRALCIDVQIWPARGSEHYWLLRLMIRQRESGLAHLPSGGFLLACPRVRVVHPAQSVIICIITLELPYRTERHPGLSAKSGVPLVRAMPSPVDFCFPNSSWRAPLGQTSRLFPCPFQKLLRKNPAPAVARHDAD